jgi:hypothetical protein
MGKQPDLAITPEPFDLAPLYAISSEFYGWVPLDDNRWEAVITDETHRILTRILNHYVIQEGDTELRNQMTIIRDSIINHSNIFPITDIYVAYIYARNKNKEIFYSLRTCLEKIRQEAVTPVLKNYLDWLLKEPFVRVVVDVYDKKLFGERKVDDALVKILDPNRSIIWKGRGDSNGNYVVDLLPLTNSAEGPFKYIVILYYEDKYARKEIEITKTQQISLYLRNLNEPVRTQDVLGIKEAPKIQREKIEAYKEIPEKEKSEQKLDQDHFMFYAFCASCNKRFLTTVPPGSGPVYCEECLGPQPWIKTGETEQQYMLRLAGVKKQAPEKSQPSDASSLSPPTPESKKKYAIAVVFVIVIIAVIGLLLMSRGPPPTYSITGRVFKDINQNGVLDGTDIGYSGWTIHLVNATGFLIADNNTDANGYYTFGNLTTGSYRVYITMPNRYFNSTSTSANVNITSTSAEGINFGIYTTYSITGRIFNDVNENRIFDGTDTISSGATVYLKNDSGSLIASSTSNANGYYSFDNLSYGSYQVNIPLPNGYLSSALTTSVVKISGADVTGIDFGTINLMANPQAMQYKYVLRGTTGTITFTVYGGLYNHLRYNENPYGSLQEVTLRYVNNNDEKSEITRLAGVIRNITPDKDDQARIAISLVQNIPYDYGSYYGANITWRYPYEILYIDKGVCSEKSRLMVCLLRELGYGCVLFDFNVPYHEAVGIKSPTQYAYSDGYAFVEAASPTIITYWYSDYPGGHLPSQPDSTTAICDGLSLNSVNVEYQDAQTFLSLNNKIANNIQLNEYEYNLWWAIVNNYGIQVG